MLKIHRSQNRAQIRGSINLFHGKNLPKFAKINGVWGQLKIIFTNTQEEVSRRITYNLNKQFSISVPCVTYNLPHTIEPGSYECTRVSDDEFVFTEKSKQLSDDQILSFAFRLFGQLDTLDKHWRIKHNTSLYSQMGVDITWLDEDV